MMRGEYGQPHSKLPPGSPLSPRSGADNPIRADDKEEDAPAYISAGLLRLREALGELARQTENRGNPVDEYNTASITGAATESTVTVLPTYEYMPEKIEAVLVAGPVASNVTVNLGDRSFPVVIPPVGFFVIAPVAIMLGRNDIRQLVSATPGIYFLELMGVADRRFAV